MTPKEIADILRRNILAPVVIALYTLSIILLTVGEYRDAYFVSSVITLNTIFAIVQEVRARIALKKLELLNAPFARLVMPDGAIKHIQFADVAVGQHLQLIPGDDIPADGIVTDSRGLEVDEGMLTGESNAVKKDHGDTLYASSSVIAGTADFTVTATGNDTRAGIITSQLKVYRPELTPLQKTISKLITWLTFFAIAVSGLIVFVYSMYDYAPRVIVKTVTSAGTVIIPEGLLLGSTILLAYGSIQLARAKVLPQKLSAIEAMALVNLLCVDKTGTLTSENISLQEIIPLGDTYSKSELTKIVGITASCTGSTNSTSHALVSGTPAYPEVTPRDVLAFTSERKLSGVRYKDPESHITHTIFLGAPEYVSQYAPLTKTQQKQVQQLTNQGLRVMLIAEFKNDTTPLDALPQHTAAAIGLITLSNDLRDGVADTIDFLQNRNVSVRVISGDNPDTVKYIAKAAGIHNADTVMTGAELARTKPTNWDKVVLKTTIFARTLPEQKERIIETFKRHGYYTGMVGDGVNDALALKKSDLGVAMYSGSNASRRVADIILLNNSFNSLPLGMRLGNRIMLAVEVIAVLFFHKIMYGLVVLFSTIVVAHPYPFAPRHNTFMNMFMVSLPTVILTLFPPKPSGSVNPKHFWRNTLFPTIPMAFVSGITVTLSYLYVTDFMHANDIASTVAVVVATLLGISMVFQAPHMLGVVATRRLQLARTVYVLAAAVVASLSFGFTITRNFFDFAKPSLQNLMQTWPILLAVVAALALHYAIATLSREHLVKNYSNR